jgi:GntR family transcriptional regulator/MocR family aminotransferase
MEDPGYFGATIAFGNVGAQIIPVPLDEEGLCVAADLDTFPHARGAYVTPAHQFPLGMTMSLERRTSLLKWASDSGAFIIEDDYDSEYRFEGRPIAALQSLDRNSNVIFVGSFNKLLFPSLRIRYVVLPPSLVDLFWGFRYRADFNHLSADQAVLCDFIADGHLGRHLRRTRDLYASRLAALIDGSKRYPACGARTHHLAGDPAHAFHWPHAGPRQRNDSRRSSVTNSDLMANGGIRQV